MFGKRIENQLQYFGMQKWLLDNKWALQKKMQLGHNAQLWFEGTVYDFKKGRIVQHKKTPCHGFNTQFVQIMSVMMSQANTSETITEVDSTTTNMTAVDTDAFGTIGGAGSNLKGIVVGTGSGAEAIGNTALTTIVAHGTGAGQLQYGTNTYAATVVSGTTAYFDQQRIFTANLSGTVSVTEVGLQGTINAATTYCLLARDLQSYSVTLGTALTLTARFIVDNTA